MLKNRKALSFKERRLTRIQVVLFILSLSFCSNWIKSQRFPLRRFRRWRILFGELGDRNSTFRITGDSLNVGRNAVLVGKWPWRFPVIHRPYYPCWVIWYRRDPLVGTIKRMNNIVEALRAFSFSVYNRFEKLFYFNWFVQVARSRSGRSFSWVNKAFLIPLFVYLTK